MNKKTKQGVCWDYIKQHGSITSWDAIKIANYTRLSDYIYKLKHKGIEVRSSQEKGKDGTYTRYSVSPAEVERAETEHLV